MMIMGIIRKKSLETLKQQKKSFINFIKTKEKYREEIADLFEDQDLEKIDDMNEVKHHLEEK
jgi:predicted house-cleaning noncanonical NTP pyrophosphatase (MazG superfamily)